MAQKKVLVVLTNVSKYPNAKRATGLWLGEAVHFAKKIESAGLKVDYLSPSGGYVPIDPHCFELADDTDWEWYQDPSFLKQLGNTLKPSEVKPEDYSAIYYAGGHGTIWDFPDNKELQEISAKIYANGGVVSSVCHGALGLLGIKDQSGELLIKNKKVTGFSNEEEHLVGLDKIVPFLTETELSKRGANYVKAPEPWAEFAVVDGRLVTGQNPASGAAVATKVLEVLKH